MRRNLTTHRKQYRPEQAHSYAVARRRRCRCGSHYSDAQRAQVFSLIRRKFSPVQISGIFKRFHLLEISTETIYRWLRRDKARGGDMVKHTRIMSKFGRKRYRAKDSRGVLAGKRHISERPTEANLRIVTGHWEGDTVIGGDLHHCLLTLVERVSGFAIVMTLSLDNDTEFHDYAKPEEHFNLKCYFATPYHSWERGSNENFNGLLRQYVPKGTCMRDLTQQQCDHFASEINNRHHKRHNFLTPPKSSSNVPALHLLVASGL